MLNEAKAATVAPIPIASTAVAARVNPGEPRMPRKAKRRS